MQDLPPVADELTPPELVGHRVQDPGVQQPEQGTDHHKRHGVACNLQGSDRTVTAVLGGTVDKACNVLCALRSHRASTGIALQHRNGCEK